MYFIYILLLTLISIVSTELPISYGAPSEGFGRFRPSQKLRQNDGFLDFPQYSPTDLNFKPPFNMYGPPEVNNNEGVTEGNNGYPNQNGDGYPVYPNQPSHEIYGVPPNLIPGYPNKPSSYYRIKPRFEKPLFSPNNGALEYPATNGQIDNYNKALQEEAQQLQQDLLQRYQKQEHTTTAFTNGFTGFSNVASSQNPPKTFVSVKFGQPNLQYQYHF